MLELSSGRRSFSMAIASRRAAESSDDERGQLGQKLVSASLLSMRTDASRHDAAAGRQR